MMGEESYDFTRILQVLGEAFSHLFQPWFPGCQDMLQSQIWR